jgi:hypothetical protein
MPKKGRRLPPKPQARPTGRKLWDQQQASVKRLVESPFGRDLQERNRQLRDSPLGRASIEQARQFLEWQERNLREPTAPAPQPERRKGGGGRKPRLTPEEIADLREAYRSALKKDSALKKHEAALVYLRPLRPATKRDIGDGILLRHIIRAVLSE